MSASNMTVSNQSSIEPARAKPEDIHCPPMSHQNSGSHGHEMYPQQLVRLIGCHAATASALRGRQDEKLH